MQLEQQAPLRHRITVLVRAILRQEGLATDVPADARLADLGLASMDMVNLMLGIEAEFDFTIPPDDLTPGNFMSVETIERMIVRRRPQGAAA